MDGPPIVLRRTVRPEDVLVRIAHRDPEWIVIPPTGAALDAIAVELDDQAAIATLHETDEVERRERIERLRRQLESMSEEQLRGEAEAGKETVR